MSLSEEVVMDEINFVLQEIAESETGEAKQKLLDQIKLIDEAVAVA